MLPFSSGTANEVSAVAILMGMIFGRAAQVAKSLGKTRLCLASVLMADNASLILGENTYRKRQTLIHKPNLAQS